MFKISSYISLKIKKILPLFIFFIFHYVGFSQNVIKVDFETSGEGYTPSATGGSGYTNIFNRSNSALTNVTNEDGYFWAAEDLDAAGTSDPYITLDQIDVTGGTSFTFSIDMTTRNYNDWDSTDELLITYSACGGVSCKLKSLSKLYPNTGINSLWADNSMNPEGLRLTI